MSNGVALVRGVKASSHGRISATLKPAMSRSQTPFTRNRDAASLVSRRLGGLGRVSTLKPMFFERKTQMVDPADALPGRDTPMVVTNRHVVLGTPIIGPFPENTETIYVAMGCFWGSERIFWRMDGVYTTAVGYMGGWTKHPTYPETCTGQTGHTETVMVVFDPSVVSVDQLMKAFWENHDPTTLNRQGGDVGTQYRSAVFATTPAQLEAVEASRVRYQKALSDAGFGEITTQIALADEAGDGVFYYAEEDHQGYLHKHPGGYCNHGFCQIGYDLDAHGQGVAQAVLPDA
jgi:peptide-methionine (S)-S-oxide reductase